MRRLIFLTAMSALVLAKPEMYREKEDFQYSRSSSDDGTKSGFYDAQRGNMGGNYEKAHNMDKLAQHQMSGLVGQVNGELGEGAKTRTGSVYTAANSRGIYGSGNYDLSNLKGRNFEEGESYGDSQSHSSLSSQNSGYSGQMYSGLNSAGYSSRNSESSRYSGYQSSSQITGHRQADNLQAIDMSQGMKNHESDSQSGHNTRYESQRHNEFDQNSANRYSSSGYGSNAQTRYIAGTPNLRLVVRPRIIYTAPIAAQTYDLSQSALSEDKTALTSDAEVLDHQINYKPNNKVKHYESSYSYRKEWEKHNTQPADVSVVVPTENPFPKNSELYDDAQLLQASNSNTNLAQTNHLNSAYSANTKYGQTQLQSGFNSQQSSIDTDYRANAYRQSSKSADIHANLHGNGAQNSALYGDLNNAESLNLKPKSYHSSYSYHKSWERKGDPYVIEPASGAYTGLTSQKLTAASANREAYSSHQYGSHSSKSHQSYAADCDEDGHVRVARSYDTDQELENQQQYQNRWENLGDYFQQTQGKLENLENLGQQTQSKWENQEDLGQQTQSQWDNLQDLGQQTQSQWDHLQQLGQQTQNEWDNLQQLGQQSQNQWDKIEDLGQQSQNQWDKIEDLGQQTQRDLEQKTQNENLEQSQSGIEVPFLEQQVNGEDIIELQKSHTQEVNKLNVWDQQQGFGQQINTHTDKDAQQISSTNKHEENKQVDELNQTSQYLNPWFQSQNTNLDDDDFLKPVHGLPNENNGDEESKLFSPIFINPENNNLNNQGHEIWNQSHYVGNEYSNINTTNNTQTPLQSLWDKIDNIAGEFATADAKTEDKSVFTDEYSTSYLFNQNRDFGDSDFSNPTYQNHYHQSVSPKTVTKTIDTTTTENNVQHNLFNNNKQIQSSNATTTQNPVVTPDSKLIIKSQQISEPEEKQFSIPDHSVDIGRGDIGPEDAVYEIDKSYKSSGEIENISLPKDEMVKNLDEVRSQQNQFRHEDNETERTLTVLSLRDWEKDGPHRQHKLFRILQTANPKTTTTPQPVAIIKHTYNSDSGPFSQMDTNTTTEVTMEFKPVSHMQNNGPLEHTMQRTETFDEIQQQNIQQQFENYGQDENTGQLQTSWYPNENLQQGYDQQNLEKQFEGFEQHANIQEQTPLHDFGQQEQNVWNSQNILQGYQNMDQQFEVFQPQNNIGSATLLQNFGDQEQGTVKLDYEQQAFEEQSVIVQHQSQDIGEQEQDFWKTGEIMQNQKKPGNLNKENIEIQSNSNNLAEMKSIQVKSESDLQSNKEMKPISDLKSDATSTPVEVSTQKPGFWKSIGTKFSNAKEKVVSWFQQN